MASRWVPSCFACWCCELMLWLTATKELDKIIGDTHTGYYGTKKSWIAFCWDVIEFRYSEKTLTIPKYSMPYPSLPDEVEVEPSHVSTAGAASSSFGTGLQEIVGENEPGGKNTIDFPKETPVEEAAQSTTEEAKDDETIPESTLEQDMERLVEMVSSVDMLNRIDWLDQVVDNDANWDQLDTIFREGLRYCRKFQEGVLLPWNVTDWPRNPRLWLGEMERCLQVMAFKKWLPYWLHKPHDRYIRNDASAAATGFSDPGNYVLDVMVHALRLWNYCDASKTHLVISQPIAEYGERANKSAKGPVNLRGNIIEAMSKNLQETGSRNNSIYGDYDPVDYWYWHGWYRKNEDEATASFWEDQASSSAWASSGFHQSSRATRP